MARPDRFFEWQTLVERDVDTPPGSRERLRVLWGLFLVGCLVIFCRAAQLEWTGGAAFRAAAAQPGRQNEILPAARGRILARDGSVLAMDEEIVNLAVHYRALEEPPNTAWLRSEARRRLPRAARHQRARLAEATAAVLAERTALHERLADQCGITLDAWQARAAQIQRRVERLAEHVNRAHSQRLAQAEADRLADAEATEDEAASGFRHVWWDALADLFRDDTFRPPALIVVQEQTSYHVVAEGLTAGRAEPIRQQPKFYPHTRLVSATRRRYPRHDLAANLLGHVGPRNEEDASDSDLAVAAGLPSGASGRIAGRKPDDPPLVPFVGRLGLERHYEAALRGKPGLRTHLTDHRGRWLSLQSSRDARPGSDVVLALDPAVQQAAETLLDRALAGQPTNGRSLATSTEDAEEPNSASRAISGAVLVMDIHSGELLAAAGAPRFDPNVFSGGDEAAMQALWTAPGRPLFDRVSKMALPPGSVFKLISAAALLESRAITRDTPLVCQGYLHEPHHLRCAIFRANGAGHGAIQLTGAIEQSCNVFFFHFAEEAGPGPLVAWAERFAVGRRTGIDLPDEAPGHLATPGSMPRLAKRAWQASDTYSLSVGQGPITATPLQVARWVAAIANGGSLVTPRVTRATAESSDREAASGDRLPLTPATLATLREGMEQVVSSPSGTGYATVRLAWPTIAGKTGTAEVGVNLPDHAWFAGYTPAEAPRWAIVVALEHGGSGATAAGPIARRMAQVLHQTGHLPSETAN